jgi:acetyl esterase/lipase
MKNIVKKILIFVAILAISIIAFFKLSPYPSVWIIRYAFNKDAIQTNEKLARLVPANIHSVLDIQYDKEDNDAYLDAYYPSDSIEKKDKLPLIVWTHGGGLISGSKTQLSNYCKILASKGYSVVSIDYTVAPKGKYPSPIRQLNKALAFISANSTLLKADTSIIVLGGDSGGSMIAATTASVITNPSYAEMIKVQPGLTPHQLRGLILYCGIYDVNNLKSEGKFDSFLKTVLWAYFGKKDITRDDYAKTASVVDHVTGTYPPTFISAGDNDPLLPQSEILSNKLTQLNVPTFTLFFNKDSLKLGHEYQFTMNEWGKLALNSSLDFLNTIKNKTTASKELAASIAGH